MVSKVMDVLHEAIYVGVKIQFKMNSRYGINEKEKKMSSESTSFS